MPMVKNSFLLENTLRALYMVAERRTSGKFADETLGATLKTLEQTYPFLKHVTIKEKGFSEGDFTITVSPEINSVNPTHVGKAIESILRVVYMDLDVEAGLFFITEFKQFAGELIVSEIVNCEVDLDQMQVEQHHWYNQQERKRGSPGENPLGYTWHDVASWNYDAGSKMCTLYTKTGRMLDRLNLDRIIQNYVDKLSGFVNRPSGEFEEEVEVYEKEYALLKMLHERDMDVETAAALLHISQDELHTMIRKLSQFEMLQFVSYDELALTEWGLSYLSKKEQRS
jgi:hypothetical protein